MAGGAVGDTAAAIAAAKLSLSPLEAFARGVLCNVLVCLAVWLCFAARDVAGALARHLQNSSDILRLYNQGYEELFVRGGDARPFIDFLRDSSTLFWDLAASISALNHGMSVWDQRTRNAEGRRLTAEPLKPLLEILTRVIV
jgi:hypothetical protein